MKTRGQITIFIIIGLVLLLLAGLYYAVSNILISSQLESTEKQALDFNQKAENVNFYVTQCVKNAAINSMNLFGMTGSFTTKGGTYNEQGLPISYLRQGKTSYLETKEIWSNTIKELFNIGLSACDFNTFESQGLSIKKGAIETKVIISDINVKFDTLYPLSIIQDSNNKQISDFSIVLPIRLGHIHDIVNTLIQSNMDSNGFLDVSVMKNIDLDINVTSHDNGQTILYLLKDNMNNLQKYSFIFADKE